MTIEEYRTRRDGPVGRRGVDDSGGHRDARPAALGGRVAAAGAGRGVGLRRRRDGAAWVKPSEIGDDVAAVRDWVARLDAGSQDGRRYALRWRAVGGRSFGRNQPPDRAVVTSLDQAWALLGVRAEAERFTEILGLVEPHPAVRAWACEHPHRALALREEVPSSHLRPLLAGRTSGVGVYLRQISAPGWTRSSPSSTRGARCDARVSGSAGGFLRDLGLRPSPSSSGFVLPLN